MKKCPYCAEEIQDEAVKCKHCGEFLDKRAAPAAQTKAKWYQSSTSIWFAFFVVGPVVLPLVWINPKYSTQKKVVISFVMIIISVLLFIALGKTMQKISEYYKMMMPQ